MCFFVLPFSFRKLKIYALIARRIKRKHLLYILSSNNNKSLAFLLCVFIPIFRPFSIAFNSTNSVCCLDIKYKHVAANRICTVVKIGHKCSVTATWNSFDCLHNFDVSYCAG